VFIPDIDLFHSYLKPMLKMQRPVDFGISELPVSLRLSFGSILPSAFFSIVWRLHFLFKEAPALDGNSERLGQFFIDYDWQKASG
jgi:hypothetical protein